MSEIDYPAAHSQDTAWYAVDRDGHVGFFYSGEAGAVPETAAAELGDALSGLPPRGRALHDPNGRLIPGREGPEGRQHLPSLQYARHVLMFLPTLDPVRDLLGDERGWEVPATEGAAVLLRAADLPADRFEQLHVSGTCRGCYFHYHATFEGDEGYSDIAARGVYYYDHLTENWISGPYGRERVPEHPLHVDELPPALRETLKQMTFDSLSFAEAAHIQPIEHAPCVSWEASWLDVTGKHVRPMPGREEEYAEAYEDLAEIAGEDGVAIEPPAGGDEEGRDDGGDDEEDRDGGGPDVLPFPERER